LAGAGLLGVPEPLEALEPLEDPGEEGVLGDVGAGTVTVGVGMVWVGAVWVGAVWVGALEDVAVVLAATAECTGVAV